MADLHQILSTRSSLTLAGAPAGFVPLMMSDLARAAEGASQRGRAVLILPDEPAMRMAGDAAQFFAPELELIEFPAWDCLPYDRASPALPVTARRIAALVALQTRADRPQLLLTTVNAATQRVLTPFRIRQLGGTYKLGSRVEREELAAQLVANGYTRADTVTDAGEFALRGSLVDLFPAGADNGVRLDFFGDEIETIRAFDPADQRSIGPIDQFALVPATETLLDEGGIKRFRTRYRERFGATATGDPLYQAVSEGRRLAGVDHWLPLIEDRLASLFDHLGPGDVVVREAGCDQATQARFEAIADYFANRERLMSKESGSYRPLPPDLLYLTQEQWQAQLAERPVHLTTPFAEPDSGRVIDMAMRGAEDFAPVRAQQGNVYEAVAGHVTRRRKQGARTIVVSYSAGSRARLQNLLKDHGLTRLQPADSWQEALGVAAGGATAMAVAPIETGFQGEDISVLSEQDMLGDRLVRRRKRRKSADAFLAEIAALSPGDLVVHADHGVARYEGLTSIPVGQSPHDCVALEYAGGDKLYVPVENIDVLTRYGADSEGVSLDRLGGEAWQRRKARMKERIREIAGELMATAAARALRPGEIAQIDEPAYASFVDRFPFEETDDQDRVIAEVLGDLESGTPMDRLVCGDVGFGKTEVALRAAFVAAVSGMQVAVIAPTTLLARQHFETFCERFRGFPLKIGRLSRLVPSGEASKTREGLGEGSIDIVVGTHAILSKSVKFKRLGLVIVDEEQRFGVTHKERLKALKTDVHMLTLTATPIPRTLQMAMSGLRELSIIKTPPVDRLAVRTYVMPWDPVVVREALLRERYRGGQSFFVVPRIKDLEEIEAYLRDDVPEIRFVTAHGQMAPSEVEERMSAYYDRKYDLLLSTTIVESGLDIPSANTMIIHRADRFGLAQLYQLRGRVGRSKTRAYAYLTTPADRALTETAEKRLKVLSDLDSLGAGFQLASHDLDIRGAGNLVGDEQSGHIKEVGYELYQSMLEEAILEAKAGHSGAPPPPETFSPQITVDAPILIPEDYVPDLALRMGLYRRLNELPDATAIEGFGAELIDRFGPLPQPTENLLKLIEIKLLALDAGVARMEVGPKGTVVSFHNDQPPDVDSLFAYVQRLGDTARLRPDGKLVITRAWKGAEAKLNGALQLARGLGKVARGFKQAA